uniref:Cyclic nucleotide-binding domain-containing protein n=1 Tax=Euplotes harpa TaxID=151035 RepID=A0A7S3JC92_9SPIT|mmetsp:Transcript_29665/g.33985  ORF Transcript_29665/g.33985 Transcript_29665/m.33985 type:complete len:335 (+) Transcript_29665:291-1295(+)
MTQEELLYSLHPETFEEGQIIFDNNDVIQNLYFVSEGEISIVLQLDNGEEVITDMLTPGSNFGTYSILKDNKQMFTFKANTFVCVQVLEREALGKCRDQFKDLNNVLLDYENYIEEVGIPACDYKTTEMNLKEKFRLAVNRSMVLNEYENKKNSKLGMLIEQLKKQHAENEIKEVKMAKRSEYKRSLGKLISEHFKENMPNYDESTMYTIEVFKFMNKLIDKLNVRIQTFDIIKEGMRLLHLALNGKSDDELEVIPEAGQDNFDFDYEDETQINEGNTGMPVLDSMDFKNEEKKSQKIFSLKHNEEEKISSKRTNEQMNDSDIINEYAKELDLE